MLVGSCVIILKILHKIKCVLCRNASLGWQITWKKIVFAQNHLVCDAMMLMKAVMESQIIWMKADKLVFVKNGQQL